MKAIILHEYGGPDKLKFEDIPDPVAGPGQVLVRVTATSINPIDFKLRSGVMKSMMPLQFPAILGRDLAGIVRAVGPDVQGFAPGDHVFALADHTYAELCVVAAADLAKVPDGLELTQAGALPLVLLTGEQLARIGTAVQPGQTILVAGAIGGVGRTAIHTAKKLGAKVIAGVRKSQLEEAAGLHADQVVALDDKAAMEKIGFLDAVADAVGGETAQMLLGKVKPGGVFGSVLGPPQNAGAHPTIQVNAIMAHPEAAKLVELAQDIVAGQFKIPIDRMIALENAAEGQSAAEKGGIGKIVLLA